MFTQVFGNASTPVPGGMPDPAVTRARDMKKSILDNVIADLNRFSGRVGTEDKAKIEAHLQSIRAIETDLDRAMVTPTGKPPVLPTGVNTGSSRRRRTDQGADSPADPGTASGGHSRGGTTVATAGTP